MFVYVEQNIDFNNNKIFSLVNIKFVSDERIIAKYTEFPSSWF